MKTQQVFFLICVGLVAWLGFSHGRMANESVVAASARPAVLVVATAATAATEGCPISVRADSIERLEIGTVSETFLVKWATTSVCVTSFRVTLNIRRADGSTRDETQNFAGSARQGLFKLLGKRDDRLTTRATATVNASGILAAQANQSKALNTVTAAPVGPGTGSNNPTPVPTFFLRGQILNTQSGEPLTGVKLEFAVVGAPLGKTSSVETNGQGRWVQEGFPVGKQVRITASKRFFVIEPATRTVSEGGVVQFSGRPNEVGAAPTPSAGTFSATGQAKVDDLAQGTQLPLSGATISFSVQNANGTKPNIPGPVTTQGKGNWNQSGFTVGVTYKATIFKSGVTFSFNTANFGGNTPGQVVSDVGFIGTLPGTPAPTKPFAVSGQVNVNSQSLQLTSPLAGATITFKLKNPNAAGAANVPGSVTSQSNGSWSQSGFTGGVSYIATCSKTGVVFGDVREFNGPSQAVNFLAKSK